MSKIIIIIITIFNLFLGILFYLFVLPKIINNFLIKNFQKILLKIFKNEFLIYCLKFFNKLIILAIIITK